MKRATLICLGLLLISGPMQKSRQLAMPIPAYLQLLWFTKAKKEILRTGQNPLLQAMDNSLHFITAGGIKQLFPVLGN